jgi:hypothetical protein
VSMSPLPSDELPPPSDKRPTSLTVVGIVGIIFGALGVLCLLGSIGMTFSSMGAANAAMMSQTDMIIGVFNAFVGLILSTFVIIGSIGVLNLRPWSRVMMIVTEAVDLIFQLFKFIVGIVYAIPKQLDMMVNHPPPQWNAEQVQAMQSKMGLIKAFSYGVVVICFLIPAAYAIVVLIVMNRPKAKAALSEPTIPEPSP